MNPLLSILVSVFRKPLFSNANTTDKEKRKKDKAMLHPVVRRRYPKICSLGIEEISIAKFSRKWINRPQTVNLRLYLLSLLIIIGIFRIFLWMFGGLVKNLRAYGKGSFRRCRNFAWDSGVVRSTYGCSVWRGIRNGYLEFLKGVRFQVGKGELVQFWEVFVWLISPPLLLFLSFQRGNHPQNRVPNKKDLSIQSFMIWLARSYLGTSAEGEISTIRN